MVTTRVPLVYRPLRGLILWVRQRRLMHEMNVVMPVQRDTGFAEFLSRIEARGIHFQFNTVRKVKAEEIPEKPRRRIGVIH